MKAIDSTIPRIPQLLENTTLIQRVGFLLNRSAQEIRDMFAASLQPLGIDPRHFGVLAFIAEGGALSQQEIARQVCCDRTTMVSVVDDLERKGLARRSVDPADRRKYAVVLTEKGRRILERGGKIAAQMEERYLSSLSASERKVLRGLLQRLVLQNNH